MITRRNFFVQGSLAASTIMLPGTLMSLAQPGKEPANHTFDVIIVGGSYAGLSAAMSLGRSLRNVLIIDSGLPCNRMVPHAHNFITHDGGRPKDIAGKAKEQVQHYETVSFLDDLAVKVQRSGSIFELTTQSGKIIPAKKILFATGLKDMIPAIPGFSDCWGISILHCPYCHGYEVRNQKTGILANGNAAFHYAPLVSNLTDKLTIFTDGKATFNEEQWQSIKKHNIPVVEQKLQAVLHENGKMSGIRLEDATEYKLAAMYARLPFEQHCKMPEEMGCELTEQGLIKVDAFQQTTVPGIYACGDNSAMRSIATAVATGSFAGAAINMELSTASFNLK
jgi:thioredoxin reductase